MKKSWIGAKSLFYEWWKTVKKHFLEISFSVFEGAPFKHFEHTKTFILKIFLIFFFNIHKKMHLIPIQDWFHKNVHIINKKEILKRKVFKLQRFSNKKNPNVGGNALFWRGH